jgi:photolyase PhrII
MPAPDAFSLPSVLERRLPLDRPDPAPDRAGPVIAWLRIAVRGHENPVLDVAKHMAVALDRPLLVYHAVSERYPHATDRHHAFILQGARDLADELDQQGLAAAFHVQRPGHRGPVLARFCEDVPLVVTDHFPLDPLRGWTRALGRVVPVWPVDASCVVPMFAMGRAHGRAFRFRKASLPLRDDMDRPWPVFDAAPRPYDGPLPFEPVAMKGASDADLDALIAACAIDHSLPPVSDTPGGSVAGYARWTAWRDAHLKRYARDRNDAAKASGVSRMSAYLHYGHVSPFRIAREAAEIGGKGAEKYLDELLVWREMSWHVCHHDPQARSYGALPEWARASLEAHSADARDVLPLEALENGLTGERIWDIAQRSLLKHGELHNNVRMTWGKAVLGWSKGPRQTFARLFELNDRLALDGRDPNSVGGLTWCLGGFDRPFDPEQPVFGRVRGRSLKRHAKRLDLDGWAARVDRPIGGDAEAMPRVLIIGAGLAGCVAASLLHRMGVDVSLADKSRGPGGRLSSRRTDHGPFDHGAPGFTVRDPRFLRQVRMWEAAGAVAQVGTTGAQPEFVGVPRSSALLRHILASAGGTIPMHTGVRVTSLEQTDAGWRVLDENGVLGTWDRIVVTAPGPQTRDILADALPALADRVAAIRYRPRWVLLATGATGLKEQTLDLDGPLAFARRQDTLPGRSVPERWVVHATDAWSEDHLEADKPQVAQYLGSVFAESTGGTFDPVVAHRWRYARVETAADTDRGMGPEEILREAGVIVAGDGCVDPETAASGVEAAWRSGAAAAGALLRELTLGIQPSELRRS